MSVPVALDELRRRVDQLGPLAFLLTTDGSHPHVVSVLVDFDGTRFTVPAGRRSRANLEGNASATLFWPDGGGSSSLIVDGTVEVDDDTVVLRPTRAVLHRLADAPTDVPNCVRIEDEPGGPPTRSASGAR